MKIFKTVLWAAALLLVCFAAVLLAMSVKQARARDLGQWEDVGHNAEVRAWFQGLLQPDTVGRGGFGTGGVSCCGDADGYYADEVHYREGKMLAVITDERDDQPLHRPHENIGNEYEVPLNKIVGKEQQLKGNPTGHVVIFLGGPSYNQAGDRMNPRPVLCYVQNGGV